MKRKTSRPCQSEERGEQKVVCHAGYSSGGADSPKRDLCLWFGSGYSCGRLYHGTYCSGYGYCCGHDTDCRNQKQQQASEAQGYAQGGFTPQGRVNEEVGVVHAGEWVASQKLLASPVARPLINALDYAQRTNSIGSLRADDVSRTIVGTGAVASPSPQPVVIQAPTDNVASAALAQSAAVLSKYEETMNRLSQRLNEPFVTVNTVTGDTGIKQAQDEYDTLMRNKSPKSKRK